MRKRLNLDDPVTFNEKLQWLKLHDRNPAYTAYVDKYEVRAFIARTIGDQYLTRLLHVFDTAVEIDWDTLPHRFVLKCTHGSGFNIICRDKAAFDARTSRKKLTKWLGQHWYSYGREWPYKNIRPRIVCEEFISDNGNTPDDYKVLCFNGKARLIVVIEDRYGQHTEDFYDTDWNRRILSQGRKAASHVKAKPLQLDEMIRLSELLATGIRHVRVDWFIVNQRLYFGEMTFYDGSGFVPFSNEMDDRLLGSWLDLGADRQKQIAQTL